MENHKSFARMLTQDNFVTEKIDVIKNGLMGDYDDKGNYIIPSQIVEELLSIDKVKNTSFGNSVFCSGRLAGFGEISFELLFDTKTKSGVSASATLFLLEDVYKINGYLQNTIRTKLEVFEGDVDDFIEKTYKHFNISTSNDDGREKKSEENEDSFILARYEYTQMLNKLLDDKYLDAYGKYFTYRFSVLTKLDNDFSRSVMDKFNTRYALIENVFLQEKDYKTLNELLDMCVEEVSGLDEKSIAEEKDFRDKVAPALDTFELSVDKLSDKYGARALNMLNSADRSKVEEMQKADEVVAEPAPASRQSVERMVSEVKTDVAEAQPKTDVQNTRRESAVAETAENAPRERERQETQIVNNPRENSFYSTFKAREMDTRESNEGRTVETNDAEKRVAESTENLRTTPQTAQASTQRPQTAQQTAQTTTQQAEQHSPSANVAENTEPRQQEVKVTSLKDRMSRLEKFKEKQFEFEKDAKQNSMEKGAQEDEKIGSVFEKLAKEKEKKSEQVSQKFSKEIKTATEQPDIDMSYEEYKKKKQRDEMHQEDDMEM